MAALTGIPVAFGVNLVVARALGPDGYGRLATYAALVGVATMVLNLGISQSTVQWMAERRLDDFGPRRLHLIRNCVGYHAFLQGPAVAAVVFFLLRESSPWVSGVAACAMLATCALGTSSVILTATAQNASLAKISMAATLALQATTIVVAVTTRSANATYAAMLIAGVLGPVLGFVLIRGAGQGGVSSSARLQETPGRLHSIRPERVWRRTRGHARIRSQRNIRTRMASADNRGR